MHGNTELTTEHTARAGTEPGNRSNVSKHQYLGEAFPAIEVVGREISPKGVIKAVQHKLHHEVLYKAACDVLRSLWGANIEAEGEQFRHMGELVGVIYEPGSIG